ncbi:MAG: hypothetical protein KF860_14625 [Cyclobacteriaceae bacterium]|nr:hypothetical protein [Cyclobacteriaceae bacterium]
MNLKELLTEVKPLGTKKIFSPNEGVNVINIKGGNQLKEHKSKIPALLVCVTGEVIFENEEGVIEKLLSGDFVEIMPNVKHWLTSNKDSDLLLIK